MSFPRSIVTAVSINLLLILSTPTALLAKQDSVPKPVTTSVNTLFADFESGSFAGWTIEGDAFGDAPATNTFFGGKIRGFGGKAFAASFHPRKGTAAVGKMISKPFMITKPSITFKIGGGMYPGQACLNLVIDGQIARTQTGDDAPQLIERSWDVSDLGGKTAHFEIVDSTSAEQRGYIMVDDIVMTGNDLVIAPSVDESSPWIDIPLRVIHVLDSQGNAEFADRSSMVLTPAVVEKNIVAINELYRSTKIRFTFDPKDFETRRDDYLDLDGDPAKPGLTLDQRNRRPIDTSRQDHIRAFEGVGAEKPDRLTILVHRGSEWWWDERHQKWLFVVGFSRGGIGLRPDGTGTIRVTENTPRVWAHELGHALGLPHTSKDGLDLPAKLFTEEDISRACQEYLKRGGDPVHPENAIDGDYILGIRDTPPDPGIGFWGKSPDLSRVLQIALPGQKPFSLFVSRNNMMAPKADVGGFTNGQIAVMRRTAAWWKALTESP